MRMNPLGRTGETISELCLGTMTYSTQTSTEDAHAQIDMALDHGINILDTAEMYPVNPVRVETTGNSEKVVGEWLAKTGRRNDLLIATKISGAGSKIRDGIPISSGEIVKTVEDSLRRLQTDMIDLYQLHWPNRGSYMFRQNWTYDATQQNKADTIAHIEDVLGEMQRMVDAGKIRHIGLSNESAWGTTQFVNAAEAGKGPRVATVQNEYSLLCRLYDTDMAEMSHNEDVGLLAFSPLATGFLTGKYSDGAIPDASRMTLNPGMGGRDSGRVRTAADAYVAIAQKHGLHPIHMALAWCRTRPFMASAIFGATNVDQLKVILGSVDVTLSDEILKEIDQAHRLHPMPY